MLIGRGSGAGFCGAAAPRDMQHRRAGGLRSPEIVAAKWAGPVPVPNAARVARARIPCVLGVLHTCGRRGGWRQGNG